MDKDKRIRELELEIKRIKANLSYEAKAKTVTIELPTQANDYQFILTAPWAHSEEEIAKKVSESLELLAQCMRIIYESDMEKKKEGICE